jgi:hypothetical protein
VLPLVINEDQIFTFNFWFNGSVHCGMYHQSELYCRLESFTLQKRPQVYQLGCKLAQQYTAIVLSSSVTSCSLWISLRHPSTGRILLTADTCGLLELMLHPPREAPSTDRPSARE